MDQLSDQSAHNTRVAPPTSDLKLQHTSQSTVINGNRSDVIQALSDVTTDAELLERARALSKPVDDELPVSSYSHSNVPYFRPPEFTRRLNVFEEVELGGLTRFECQCRGHPRPFCTWYLDDVEIPRGAEAGARVSIDTSREQEDGTLRVIIRDAQKSDEGAYKCRAENEEGVASTTGYLSILGSSFPPQQQQQLTSTSSSMKARCEHPVSSAPLLRAISEQQSMEERETEAYEQEITPLQRFIDNVERGATSWPYRELDFLRTEEQRAAAAATVAAADAYVTTASLNDDELEGLRERREETESFNTDWVSVTSQQLTGIPQDGPHLYGIPQDGDQSYGRPQGGDHLYGRPKASHSRVTLMETSNVSLDELAAAQSAHETSRDTQVQDAAGDPPVHEASRAAPVHEASRDPHVHEASRNAVHEAYRDPHVHEAYRDPHVHDAAGNTQAHKASRAAPVQEASRAAPVQEASRAAPVHEAAGDRHETSRDPQVDRASPALRSSVLTNSQLIESSKIESSDAKSSRDGLSSVPVTVLESVKRDALTSVERHALESVKREALFSSPVSSNISSRDPGSRTEGGVTCGDIDREKERGIQGTTRHTRDYTRNTTPSLTSQSGSPLQPSTLSAREEKPEPGCTEVEHTAREGGARRRVELDLSSLIDWWSEWVTVPWIIYPCLVLIMTLLSSCVELNPAILIVVVALLSASIFLLVHPIKPTTT